MLLVDPWFDVFWCVVDFWWMKIFVRNSGRFEMKRLGPWNNQKDLKKTLITERRTRLICFQDSNPQNLEIYRLLQFFYKLFMSNPKKDTLKHCDVCLDLIPWNENCQILFANFTKLVVAFHQILFPRKVFVDPKSWEWRRLVIYRSA